MNALLEIGNWKRLSSPPPPPPKKRGTRTPELKTNTEKYGAMMAMCKKEQGVDTYRKD